MSEWELQVRPHVTPYFAYAGAAVIVAVSITLGALLKVGSTGVVFRTADQLAIAALGVVIAAAVLLFARPRLRAGQKGLLVRNFLGEKRIGWDEVVGISFPPGARWARIELPDDEYIPLMAIQAVDKGRAVAAMDGVRSLLARYQSAS